MAIVIALQQRAETSQSLADKFEVSRRTILRDMQSLAEMGIPLYSVAGPTGGFRLMDGFRLPPLQLDAQEALTVLFALRGMTKLTDTPFNQARWTVMDKLTQILPGDTLEQIEPLLDRLEMEVPRRRYKAPFLSELIGYTSRSQWINAFYRSENHQRWLLLLPSKIYTAHGFWYCEAYSPLHDGTRVFRIDRFNAVQPAAPPEGAEQASSAARPRTAEQAQVRIRALLTYKGMLQVEQDEHIGECLRDLGEDRWEVDFECPASEWAWAVRLFFSLGMNAEVVEPDRLRRELYDLSAELCARYAASDAQLHSHSHKPLQHQASPTQTTNT